MRKNLNKKIAVVALGAVALTGTGVAYAYWTTDGDGEGSATTGTTAAVTVVQTEAPSALVPGIAQDLTGTFDNPNTFPVYVGAVTVTVDPTWSVGTCDDEDFDIVDPDPTTAEVSVDDDSTWAGGTIELINKPEENQDDCKDLTAVPLLFSLSAS